MSAFSIVLLSWAYITNAIINDFSIGIQVYEGDPGEDVGAAAYTPYAKDGGGWSAWASDPEWHNPNGLRLGLFGRDNVAFSSNYIQDIDIRFAIQATDNWYNPGNDGPIQYTPWISEGGGWSGYSRARTNSEWDAIRILLETRNAPGMVIESVQTGATVAENEGGGNAGPNRYTAVLNAVTTATWSAWISDDNDLNPQAGRIYLAAHSVTPAPTYAPITWTWIQPTNNDQYVVNNILKRYESIIRVRLSDSTGFDAETMQILANCQECFIWQYNPNNNGFISLTGDAIIIYNELVSNRAINSRLIINPLHTVTDIYCLQDENNNILQPGNSYEFRLMLNLTSFTQTVTISQDTPIVSTSPTKNISMNETPTGYCTIANHDQLNVFDAFRLNCDYGSRNIKYNALMNGVKFQHDFVNNASLLEGIVGIGDLNIIVLIKDEYESITYYTLNQTFSSVNGVDQNITSLVDDVFWYMSNDFNGLTYDLWLLEIVSLYSVTHKIYEFDLMLLEARFALQTLMEYTITYSKNA
eukprot:554215_1